MQFPQTFVPTARDVGLLPMATEFSLVAAMFAFAGGFVFFLASRTSVAPWHRSAALISAVICLVTAASYWTVHYYYHDMLHQLAAVTDSSARHHLVRDAYFAIGPYRYMAWAVSVPLLLLRMVLVLKVKPGEVLGLLAVLLGAALWMVVAAFIGDQQLAPDGEVLALRHSLWGFGAALGYGFILYVLFRRLAPMYGGNSDDEAGHAFRVMAWTTFTTWAVYPVGYLASAFLLRLDLNWVQIAFTVADVVNNLGVFIVAYLLGVAELERRVPPEAIQPARMVS
jgi:bacteriorhodopsin